MAVVRQHLVRQRKSVAVDGQPNEDLFAIRPVVARVATLGLGVGQGATFKESGGDIVEKQGLVQTKQSSLALGQGGFDGDSLGRQPIQVAVERIFRQEWEIEIGSAS